MKKMTVADLIAALSKLPQDATVVPVVGWAGDTATSDKEGGITVKAKNNTVEIEGWLSNCGTTLEMYRGRGRHGNLTRRA